MTDDLPRQNERREKPRFSLNVPLTVFIGEGEIQANTRDISEGGVYFYLPLPDGEKIDSDFEFVLKMPPEFTFSPWSVIRCRGRIVRKEPASADFMGIAAVILEYSILKESITND
jgi:hypothetical protein